MRYAVVAFAFAVLPTPASAISDFVKRSCNDEYFRFCSAFSLESRELRSCMRKHRDSLSKTCLNALAKSGEASKADIEDYKRAHRD